ncbi:DUF1275 domain-containing protein [Pseudoduganella eburnea]|uniref:DUF1275 domain-containing protein n=1 Tax=Massilia eburnea TaxID=1776165 RepID=A0A6L6QDY3_9BURK|nr:YoaK family protein [Massilia eburnea]MTW09893.1 DUF1275 domain-containing protein [Massilia eburnea]
MTANAPRDPLVILLYTLTVTTGLIDAVSVLGLGRVFTANMTGNIVFMGFAVGGAPGFSIPRCLVAVASFLFGAAIAGRLGKAMENAPRRRWLSIIAGIEAGLFFVSALIAAGYDIKSLEPAVHLYAMIVMTGIAMGLRNATVRRLSVADLTATVLTLTLTGIAADSSIAGGANPRWGRRVAAVVLMFLGAALGAALVLSAGLAAPLWLTGVAVLLATFLYTRHPDSQLSQKQAQA